MKSVKGKNLQDFTPLLRAHSGITCTVSDGDYCEISHLIAQRASTPGTEGGFIVGLNPSQTHHHKIVRRARTVLGSLPETLLSLLGLEHLVAGLLGSSFAPWCKRCSSPARTRPQRALPALPDHGFVALAVAARGIADVTLTEWCELLGAERARCSEGLVSVSDLLPDATGEPVLKVCGVGETGSLRSEAERWFASGGGELIVYHLATRGAPVQELARLNPLARCASCEDEILIPTVAELAALPDCPRCRGEGWIEVSDARLQACDECDGYGSNSEVALGECGPVALRHLGCLSFDEVAELLARDSDSRAAGDMQALQIVSRSPFAEYAIGTPTHLLSTEERAQLSVLSAELSGLSGILFVGDNLPALTFGASAESANRACIIEPQWVSVEPSLRESSKNGNDEVRLTRCDRGPLSIAAISFPLGQASLLRSSSASAPYALLDEVSLRFKKRRKLASSCSFGELRECVFVDSEAEYAPTVLEALGLEDEVAQEIARTQSAQRAGLSASDLVLGHSSRRCGICAGNVMGASAEVCFACSGSGLSAQVCSVTCVGATYGDLLTTSLKRAGELLWMNDLVSEVIAGIPDELATQVTPATRVADLSVETARFLRLYGGLKKWLLGSHRGGSRKQHLKEKLLLLWKPFGLTMSHQQTVFRLLNEALAAGATVVAAGVPAALEKWFGNVLELTARSRSAAEAARDKCLDSRFSRTVFFLNSDSGVSCQTRD
jgi:hypothetical protein